jgi:hypothetical protein
VAGEKRGHIAFGHIIKQREHLVANPHAPERCVGIHRVIDGREPERGTQRHRVGPAKAEQGPLNAARARASHGGHPVETGPPEQVQDDRLGQVVGGVAGPHIGRKNAVTGMTGPLFQVGSRRHRNLVTDEGHAEAFGQRGNERGFQCGLGTQPMVHMGNPRAQIRRCAQNGKRSGIGTTRHGAPASNGREAAPSRELLQQISHR